MLFSLAACYMEMSGKRHYPAALPLEKKRPVLIE
jgi:hypothetical protein